jgi:exodeoxyribonuclease V alpha subunit
VTRAPDRHPAHPDVVVGEPDPRLRALNAAGVLSAADVHTARRLALLTGVDDVDLVIAAAVAVRAPRYGHVHADLRTVASTAADEDGRSADVDPAVWPDAATWADAVAGSPLLGDGGGPLHLDGDRLYLDRHWRDEHRVARAVLARLGGGAGAVRLTPRGAEVVDALLADPGQRAAAHAALSRRLAVVAGGPGTGKTSAVAVTVAVALAHARRPDGRPVRVGIAAPTGKAAARLAEALRRAARDLPEDLVPDALAQVVPVTLHRLLGLWPGGRARHDADQPLPLDLVIVDEVSMVALGQLRRLLDATPPDAHLVLVGDPGQLAAVEAGTVLGDLVAAASAPGSPLAGAVTTLRTGFRYGGAIDRLAQAVAAGDAAAVLDMASTDPGAVGSAPVSLVVPDRPGAWPTGDGALAPVRRLLVDDARAVVAAAASGDVDGALAAVLRTKVLCAHRNGPDGVAGWNAAVEGWVHQVPPWRRPEWYPGRPVLLTDNDPDLRVHNGDVGVVVRDGDRLRVAVDGRAGRPVEHRRLPGAQTVHAMTVHKSQGSQFTRAVVVLPAERSPILTRELLFTAVTRAADAVVLVASPQALADAVGRRVTRASALSERILAGT